MLVLDGFLEGFEDDPTPVQGWAAKLKSAAGIGAAKPFNFAKWADADNRDYPVSADGAKFLIKVRGHLKDPSLVVFKVDKSVGAKKLAAFASANGIQFIGDIMTGGDNLIATVSKAHLKSLGASAGSVPAPADQKQVGVSLGLKGKSDKPKSSGKWVSAGGVVIPSLEKAEKVYIVKPTNNYGPWAFPKGRVDKGESLRQAALREVFEETGMTAKIIGPGSDGYLGRGTGTMSVSHFFLMVRTGGKPTPNEEMEEIKLVTWERAKQYFTSAGNKRDGAIADLAVQTLKGMELKTE